MKDRYTFPIFDNNQELIGFSGRLIKHNDNLPKWKHIGQKKNFIFPNFSKEFIRYFKRILRNFSNDFTRFLTRFYAIFDMIFTRFFDMIFTRFLT